MKKILYLTYLNIKSNKIKNFIITGIAIIFMLLIILLFSGKKSISNFINNYLNSNFYYRIISVKIDDDDRNEIIKKIKNLNIKNVSHIYQSNNEIFHVTTINYNDTHMSGYVELYGVYDGINYTLDNGRTINNDNEMVCSSKFYPGDFNEVTSNNLYNLKRELNNKFDISFNQEIFTKKEEYEIYKTYNYKLKLVGTFDINKDLTGYNICYISKKFLEKILDESKLLYEDISMKKDQNEGLDILILANNYENVDEIIKILNNNGYEASNYFELDTSFYDNIKNIVNICSIIILAISIICIIIFIRNILSENEKNIALYIILGFDNKMIKKIFIIQYILIISLSLIITVMSSILLKIVVYKILSNFPTYSVLIIKLTYKELFLYYIITLVAICLAVNSLFKYKSSNKLIKKIG